MFISRKSRGDRRSIYNEPLDKFPGLYNENGRVEVKVVSGVTEQYDIFNLTAARRVISMEKHFELVSNVFKQQLKTDQFDDYGLPVSDTQRLIGRIINMDRDDPKLNESNIGLLNLSDENGGGISKIKLHLTEVPSYSFYEGEIVVVEGTYDSTQSKLLVQQIHKPTHDFYESPSTSVDELRKQAKELYNSRSVQVLVACGPFTFKNSVSYQGLIDFLQIAKKEQP